ncbi:MAG: AAA family ATPase [Candidatus Desulfacyla sp.]
MERLQHDLIKRDLPKKMVLLIGPRQVGKTYLSRQIARSYSKHVYLNYDAFEDRGIIQQAAWLPDTNRLFCMGTDSELSFHKPTNH